jgi:hypothetical protein
MKDVVRLSSRLLTLASFLALTFARGAFAAPQNGSCNVQPDLQHEISEKYPGSKLVSLSDLYEDDRKLFQKEHGKDCPGLVKVDFYGDKKPTLALVLTTGEGANQKAELVVARKLGENWKTTLLETAGSSVPVVWRQKPGKYTDVYGNKTIRATKPVIVFCGYESWAILYAWTGKSVDKVWLAD